MQFQCLLKICFFVLWDSFEDFFGFEDLNRNKSIVCELGVPTGIVLANRGRLYLTMTSSRLNLRHTWQWDRERLSLADLHRHTHRPAPATGGFDSKLEDTFCRETTHAPHLKVNLSLSLSLFSYKEASDVSIRRSLVWKIIIFLHIQELDFISIDGASLDSDAQVLFQVWTPKCYKN